MQVFLLHFAGGNCYSFDFLRRRFPTDAKIIAAELPGRGKRYREPLLYNKRAAIADYVSQLRKGRNREAYVIYGHSMGATLGLSVTKEMEALGDPPRALIVSGNAGPGTRDASARKRYLMDDEDFKKELVKLGGLPDEFLQSEALFEHFAPILRADFELLEKEDLFESGLKISTPIHAVMGDLEETAHRISNWKEYTGGPFTRQLLPGNHFFINQHPAELADIIMNCYARYNAMNML